MRLIMIVLTIAGITVAFVTHSPGVLGFSLLAAFIGAVGTIFSIAGARIADRSRPDAALLEPDVVAAIRDRAKRQAEAGSAQARPAATSPHPMAPRNPPQG